MHDAACTPPAGVRSYTPPLKLGNLASSGGLMGHGGLGPTGANSKQMLPSCLLMLCLSDTCAGYL